MNFVRQMKLVGIGFLVIVVIPVSFVMTIFFGFVNNNKGTLNTEVWSQSVSTFNLDYTVQIEKQAGKDFVILNLADTQVSDWNNMDVVKNQISDLISYRRPDLITMTGDNANVFGQNNYKKLFNFINNFGIPFAPVFGNHDGESIFFDSRNKMADFYMTLENCIFKKGPSNLGSKLNPSIGNYVITIWESDPSNIVKSLILMDSGAYYQKGYSSIQKKQIEWYEWVIRGLGDIESMLFFHIPLIQTRDAYEYGQVYENSWCSDGPDVYIGGAIRAGVADHGMYDSILSLNKEVGNGTKFIFNGHDHGNNFSLTDKNGITFTQCLKTGNCSYNKPFRTGGTFAIIEDVSHKLGIENKIIKQRSN